MVLLVMVCGMVTGPLAASTASAATATPVADEREESSLGRMLGAIGNFPLGANGATVTYADVALQSSTLGVAPPPDAIDSQNSQQWLPAIQSLALPQSTGQYWARPEWREAFGFDLSQIERAVEYTAPPLSITAVRGTFDLDEVRSAWTQSGYQPLDTEAGEIFAIREDFEVDLADPNSRMAMAHLNVVAIAEDGTLLFGSSRNAVQMALAAANGQGPSFAERPDIAPLVRIAPPDLVSALLVDGDLLQATPDPAGTLLEDESPADFATRTAAAAEEAQRMPPIGAALLGHTAGLFPESDDADSPAARVVALLITPGHDAALRAAGVVEDRLATQTMPAARGGDLADRGWDEVFAEWSVSAVPAEPVVHIDLDLAPGVSPFILQNLVFARTPGFLAWVR